MAAELIVPGLNGSGPDHWQSWWLRQRPEAGLVKQENWCRPDLDDWCWNLSEMIWRHPGAIVVAHSLGCATLAHVAHRNPNIPVGAALLVAPADAGRCENLPESAVRFGPLPATRFRFPAVVVASRNDPFMTFHRSSELAAHWGAELLDWGDSGHINAASGFGPWRAGTILADQLLDLSTRPADARDIVGHALAFDGLL